MDEAERLRKCEDVSRRIYTATGHWLLDEVVKLTEPEIDMARLTIPFKLPEPTPVERGVLNRYQDRRLRVRKRKAR